MGRSNGSSAGDSSSSSGALAAADRTKKRKRAKDEALFGAFMDSDEGSDRPRKRSKSDTAAPMSFIVSASTRQVGSVDESEAKSQGASAVTPGGRGTGDRAAAAPAPYQYTQSYAQRAGVSSTPSATGGLGSSGSATVTPVRVQVAEEFAQFEKHTKGFGSKMLAKMGWKPGEGIGKNKQGRAEPVAVVLPPVGGSRSKTKPGVSKDWFAGQKKTAKPMPMETDEQPEGAVKTPAKTPTKEFFAPAQGAWKKGAASGGGSARKAKAPKVRFDDGDAPPAAGSDAESEPAGRASVATTPRQVILDMTGAGGPRRITSLDQAGSAETAGGAPAGGVGVGASVSLRELRYNVRMLAEFAEIDAGTVERSLARDALRLKDMRVELGRVVQAVDAAPAVTALADMLKELTLFHAGAVPGAPSTAPDLAALLSRLLAREPELYWSHRIAEVALPLLQAPLAARLKAWAPTADAAADAEIEALFASWQPLLASPASSAAAAAQNSRAGTSPALDVYVALVETVWVPRVRSFIANTWAALEPEPLCVLLRRWRSLAPPHVRQHLLARAVLPKLERALEDWDPRRSPIAAHLWLHPWLPFFGAKLESLFAPLRYKLASLLTEWLPDDPSALAALLPWRGVFSAPAMGAFLTANIVPKLEFSLAEGLVIDPAAQDLAPFLAVTAWAPLLDAATAAPMLVAHFFPKWLFVLHEWLRQGPDYDELSVWYSGWKGLLPPAWLAAPAVAAQFTRALDTINASIDSPDAVPVFASPAAAAAAGAPGGRGAGAAEPKLHSTVAARGPATFRELVESYLEAAGLLLMPLGRSHEGHALLDCGGVAVYLDGAQELVFASAPGGGGFKVTTLDDLVRRASK